MTHLAKDLHQAIENGNLQKINELLNSAAISALDILDVNEKGQNIFDIAIEHQYFLVVETLIKALQKKDKAILKSLLLTDPTKRSCELPIVKAAALKNREIYDLLIQLQVGYSIADLEKVKKAREEVIASERTWGTFGAILESACPSKSIADLVNSPMLVGGGFITSIALLFTLTAFFASLALLGFGLITYANYKKLIAERNLENESLNIDIISVQISNFEIKIAELIVESNQFEQLSVDDKKVFLKRVNELKDDLKKLSYLKANSFDIEGVKEAYSGKAKSAYDFLTKKDRLLSTISTIGNILCTFAAVMSLAGLALGLSGATLGVSIAVFAAVVLVVSIYYFLNQPQQFKELGEQRKLQFDNKKSLYKKLLNLEHNSTLSTAHELLQDYDSEEEYLLFIRSLNKIDLFNKDKAKFLEKNKLYSALRQEFKEINSEQKNLRLLAAAFEGDLRLFKRLIYLGATIKTSKKGSTTALHVAVEKGYFLLVEEMLGVSIAASARQDKLKWEYKGDDQDKQSEFAELQERRQEKLANYKRLTKETKELLLVRDEKGMLPLHYSANLKDSTLYYLLIKQPVGYSKADLEKAYEIRKAALNKEKNWAILNAVVEAICPTSSIGEIVGSVAFAGLLASAGLGLSIIVGISSLAIFSLVVYGSYYKEKVERGINEDLEQLMFEIAFARNIEIRINELSKKTVPLSEQEREELIHIKTFINTPRSLKYEGKKTKISDFINTADKVQVLVTTLGTFLCAYSGTLGILGLGFSLYAVGTAATSIASLGLLSVLAAAGPVGWGILAAGALIGLCVAIAFTYYYYQKRDNELKVFGESRQAVYAKENSLATTINELKDKNTVSPLLDQLLNDNPQSVLQINESVLPDQTLTAFQKLNGHDNCPINNCGLIKEKEEEDKQSLETETPSVQPREDDSMEGVLLQTGLF